MSELVKALRWLANETEFVFADETLTAAADTIDRLTAENAELYGRLAPYEETGLTAQEYTESVGFVLALNKAIKKATGKTAFDWEKLTAENAELREQLAIADGVSAKMTIVADTAQRRERAAVEDLKHAPGIWPCYACKHTGQMSDRCHKSDRDCFEWRGVKEEME